jgi:multicomponent Na+:H+ antiporter subunit B
VSAINFDYRGFDTLGEEFILFAAVVGVASLLRELRGERNRAPATTRRGRRVREPSVAVRCGASRWWADAGHRPLRRRARAPDAGRRLPGRRHPRHRAAAVLPRDQYVTLRRVGPMALIELAEATGAAALGLIGIGGMIWAGAYFANFLGVGHAGRLLSAGSMLPGSIAVGLAVTGGFALHALGVPRADAGRPAAAVGAGEGAMMDVLPYVVAAWDLPRRALRDRHVRAT